MFSDQLSHFTQSIVRGLERVATVIKLIYSHLCRVRKMMSLSVTIKKLKINNEHLLYLRKSFNYSPNDLTAGVCERFCWTVWWSNYCFFELSAIETARRYSFRHGVNNYSPNISPGLGGIKQTSEEILIGFAVMLKTRCLCRMIIRERRRRLNDVFISVRARLFD